RKTGICYKERRTVRAKRIDSCRSQIHLTGEACNKVQSQHYYRIYQDTVNYHHIIIIVQHMRQYDGKRQSRHHQYQNSDFLFLIHNGTSYARFPRNPLGFTKRKIISSTNDTTSLYTAGSTVTARFSTIPIKIPPTITPGIYPKPPITPAEKPFKPMEVAIVVLIVNKGIVKSPIVAQIIALIPVVMQIFWLTLIPIKVEAFLFCATHRIAFPVFVKLKKH